ncbi:MAG TPA: hypothetical protein HA364_06170 [Thermoplasmata archaeon]|nr:hypothetical protein [Thermoplasmata archaeon]
MDFWMDSEAIIKSIRRTGVETVYDRRFRKLYRRRTSVERFFSKLESMNLLRRFRVFGTKTIEKLFRLIGIGFLVLALLAVRTRRKGLLRSPKRVLRSLSRGSRGTSHPTSPSGCASEDWTKSFLGPENGQGRGRFHPILGRDLGREERFL